MYSKLVIENGSRGKHADMLLCCRFLVNDSRPNLGFTMAEYKHWSDSDDSDVDSLTDPFETGLTRPLKLYSLHASNAVDDNAESTDFAEGTESESNIASDDSVIDSPYDPGLELSQDCTDDVVTTDDDDDNVPQLPQAPLNKECIPVESSQVTVRAKRGRKRKKNYTRADNKRRRNSGLSCESRSTTKMFPAKRLKESCRCKRLQCYTKISEARRQCLFKNYWDLGDINQQRQFIVNCVLKQNKERHTIKSDNSRRHLSFKYILF